MSRSGHPDFDELLSAYLDGELSARERSRIERRLAEDPAARRSLEELRRTVDLVRALPRHGAPAALLEDLRVQLERADLLDADRDEFDRGGVVRRGRGLRWLAVAASLAIVSSAGWWVWSSGLSGLQRREQVADRSPARQESPIQGRDREGAVGAPDQTHVAADSTRRMAGGRKESEIPAPARPDPRGDLSKSVNESARVAVAEERRKTVPAELPPSPTPLDASATTPLGGLDEPIRVQVAAESESDVSRLKTLVQRELLAQQGGVVQSPRIPQDHSTTRRDDDRKKRSVVPVVDELAVEAPVEVVNHVIAQLAQPSSRARSVSLELEGRTTRGIAPVQSALADLAGRRVRSQSSAASEAGANPADGAILDSAYPALQPAPLPTEQAVAAAAGTDNTKQGDSAEDRDRALTNQSMEVRTEADPKPRTSNGAAAGKSRSESTSRSSTAPSLVERRLREAASQRVQGFGSRDARIQGPPEPGLDLESSRADSTPTLTVVFEFVIEAGSGSESASKPSDSDADRSKKDPPESASREKKEEGEKSPR